MGREIIKGKNGKLKIYSNVSMGYVGEYNNCDDYIRDIKREEKEDPHVSEWIKKGYKQPLTSDGEKWIRRMCAEAIPEEQFNKRKTYKISAEDIMKYSTEASQYNSKTGKWEKIK